jgi:protein TonB
MYANRSSLPFGINPAGLGFAVLVNGAIVGAMIFLIAPNVLPKALIPPLIVETILPPDPPPPVEQPKPKTDQPLKEQQIVVPATQPKVFNDNPILDTTTETVITPVTPDLGDPKGTAIEKPEPPKPIPPLIGAQPDPRYANQFQPEYPGQEIRMNRDGTVSVRVLIGTDGRVKAVEQIRATSTAFFEATRRHALSKWRFKPATRGGEPQESWKTMNVRFELSEQ